MKYFRLGINNEPISVTKEEYQKWRLNIFGVPLCSVGRTPVRGTIVSTVFLGICDDDKELPFETIVYDNSSEPRHYATWKEAELGHKEKVEELLANEIIDNEEENSGNRTSSTGTIAGGSL